jgi:hypothetical protein
MPACRDERLRGAFKERVVCKMARPAGFRPRGRTTTPPNTHASFWPFQQPTKTLSADPHHEVIYRIATYENDVYQPSADEARTVFGFSSLRARTAAPSCPKLQPTSRGPGQLRRRGRPAVPPFFLAGVHWRIRSSRFAKSHSVLKPQWHRFRDLRGPGRRQMSGPGASSWVRTNPWRCIDR